MKYYVHNLDPFAVHFFGEVGIRWYGLAYVAGFLFTFLLLRNFSKQGAFDVPINKVEGFVTGLALLGVLLGGRLGYCFLYGWDYVLADPLYPLKLWEGGMASHGGMVGVFIYVLCYARRYGHSFWRMMDGLVCVVPVGLFFGRIANFINGELWGRVTDAPWAVIFPQAGDRLPRHPSQLYEAAGEGFLLFLLLWFVRRSGLGKMSGFLSGTFLLGYGVVRFGVEFLREPDSDIYWEWMSKGQLYSLCMVVAGVVLYVYVCVSRRATRLCVD